ncbi:peptidase C39 [Helicobacter sp. MIT 11-5569]|uniref:C39 family peptidase n=1 Tax=Helicobacter sp. MIT 11-5569 TaxID=1548151 RepID=UPI000690E828|nr:cysteine peptidase family C39 domain-containing protein [Helicobacter sp. MIT 11-5569]TLD81282.1 peptidase C39 [Helicobacter sp. MIT 11-5569]
MRFGIFGKFCLCFWLLFEPLRAEFILKSYQEIKNQRVIRQNYEESCGAAGLATLLNLLENRNFNELDLLKIMSEKEMNTDMVSFADLNEAVQKLGFASNAYLIHRNLLDKFIQIPILVKIEDDPRYPHFVVIINHKGDYLQVLDPSFGEYTSSKRQFFSIWDRNEQGGYALIVAPQSELNKLELKLPHTLNLTFSPFSLY